jgi:predicted CXXCH cytochrome family protein
MSKNLSILDIICIHTTGIIGLYSYIHIFKYIRSLNQKNLSIPINTMKRVDGFMKKTNYIKQLTLHLFILIVFLCSFLFPFPSDFDYAEGTIFSFNVTKPDPNQNEFVNKNVEFSGNFSIDSAKELTVKIVVDNIDPANPIDISNDIIKNPDNTWKYTKEFTEDGPHTVIFTATDGTTEAPPESVTFTVDSVRPVISNSNYKLISNINGTYVETPIEDMTHVPLNAKIQITVEESNELKFPDNGDTYNPIIVKSDSQEDVTSIEDWSNPPEKKDGKYDLTFTPSISKPLKPGVTYYVYITTDIIDKSGNSVFPKVLKFTTTSDNDLNNPHGDYAAVDLEKGINRTNLCATCHSTHLGVSKGLLGGNYKETEENTVNNYCMACHDGTTASRVDNNGDPIRIASKVDNMGLQTGSKHDEFLDKKHLPNQGSCSSCHDPHLMWTSDNPNMLKDHFVFDHTGVQDAPPDLGIVDSDNTLCESCHDDQTGTKKDSVGVEDDFYHYNKSTTRTGALSDFALCLRCHNAEKVAKHEVQSDIQSLYENSDSKHSFTALDGSNVTGPLPCAECHESHGSSNIKLLKSKLGHENQQDDFEADSGDWNAAKEKQFCTKCHNDSTAVYGKKGPLPKLSSSSDHDPESTKTCSECHGGQSKSFIEAAHAPQRTIKTP